MNQLLCVAVALSLAGPIQLARAKPMDQCRQSSDPDRQIEACTAITQSGEQADADLATAYSKRGNAYADRGQLDRAIANYDQALRLDSSYSDAYFNRGFTYIELNDYGRAVSEFDQVLQFNPGDADAYLKRGFAYFQMGEFADAISNYDQVLRLDPT